MLSPFLSFFSARLWTLLLRLDLRNLRHPSREQCNLQVEANASHDFGPYISVQIPSLTPRQDPCPGLSACLIVCELSIPSSMYPCWNHPFQTPFQIEFKILCHQSWWMVNQNMRSPNFSTLNWTTDGIFASSCTWLDGQVMKALMKKHPGS